MNGTNSSAKHYDMVVIGSGAAGHHGAIQAAKLGKKVAVVERSIALGGASINTGTIPSRHSGGCPAFYPIRVCGSPDLGLKPGTENRGSCVQRSFAAIILFISLAKAQPSSFTSDKPS
jgi:choline dehydrogenase-like flavoprotein